MSLESYKSRAIVLYTMPHSERGHIVYMFTEMFGRVSYYVNSGKRGVATIGGDRLMLHPLSLLEIVGTMRSGALHKIKEAKRVALNISLLSDVYKSAISMFLSEFLYRSLRDDSPNQMLFDYLYHSINLFDALEKGKSNFHIYFLVHLTKYFGFYPNTNYQEGNFFDMTSGDFVIIRPSSQPVMEREESALLWRFMQCSIGDIASIESNGKSRSNLLEQLVRYFSIQSDTKYNIKSLEYLREIF